MKHEYKGIKILKIISCGQVGYAVKNMDKDFYKRFYGDGIFNTLKEAKKSIDIYFNERRMVMSKSEYIIWRAETKERIKEEHPEWNNEQITKYLNAVEAILETKGMIVKNF